MKPNNLVALFIAVILIVTGAALGIIHQRSLDEQEGETGIQLDKNSSEPQPAEPTPLESRGKHK